MNLLRTQLQTLLYLLLCLLLLNGCGGSLLNLSEKTPEEITRNVLQRASMDHH